MDIESLGGRILIAILIAFPLTLMLGFLLTIIGVPVINIIQKIIKKIKG